MKLSTLTLLTVFTLVSCIFFAQFLARWAETEERRRYENYEAARVNLIKQCRAMHRDEERFFECVEMRDVQ